MRQPDSSRCKGRDMKTIQIQLVRSVIGCSPVQRRTVKAMGLRRIRQTVTLPDNSCTLGMVSRVNHLVKVISS